MCGFAGSYAGCGTGLGPSYVSGAVKRAASAGEMPAFASTLTDTEIWAVLAYIKSTWPPEAREYQKALSGRSGSGR